MKKQSWVHDRATDAWQALRIHGEFIKGFDLLTGLGDRIEESQSVDKITELREAIGKLSATMQIQGRLENLQNFLTGDIPLTTFIAQNEAYIFAIDQSLSFTMDDLDKKAKKRFAKFKKGLISDQMSLVDIPMKSTDLKIDLLGDNLFDENAPIIAEAYSDVADITTDINKTAFINIDKFQQEIVKKTKTSFSEIHDLGIEHQKQQMDMLKQRNQEIKSLSFEFISELATLQHTQTMNSLKDINALEEAELSRIKNTSEYKIAVATGDQKKVEALEKKAKNASYNERVKKFNADQNLAKTNILISLAQSIMRAYSDYGFPAGIPVAGLMGAISLAQLSTINSAPKPEKYQYGGLVGGNLHSGGGTIIEAERGEYVMSRNAVQNFGLANMNAINNGSASPVNITFNNPVMSEDYTEDVIIPQIKRAVQRGADIGIS